MSPFSKNSIDVNTLTQVIEKTVNAVVITDTNCHITWVNHSFERTTGYSFAEAQGKHPGRLLQGPETAPEDIESMRQAIAYKLPFSKAVLNYTKSGQKYWNYIECQPLYENDRLTGYMALLTDVTSSVVSQNKLIEANNRALENSERLQLAFAGGQVGSWDWSPAEDRLVFDKSWANLVGADYENLTHNLESWEQRIHPEDLDLFSQQLAAVTSNNQDYFISEHRILCDHNQYRWTMARGQVVTRNDLGLPTRVVGVHFDITRQKQTQNLLDTQNTLLRTILNVIPFSVSWKDSDLRYLGCNDNFLALSGYKHSRMILGKTDSELKPESTYIEQQLQDELKVVSTGTPLMHQIESRVSANGGQNILDTNKVPLNLNDNTTGILEVSIDITELEMAREALRQKELELRRHGRMQAVGELAGGGAHEFNNLLQTIRGYVCFAQDELNPQSSAYSDLSESIFAIDRAVQLTQQLLHFSRIDNIAKIKCEPDDVIEDLKNLLKPLMPDKINLNFELALSLPPIRANTLILGQAILNLCLNARDAIPDGGTITIGTRLITSETGRDQIGFYVIDPGTGIREEIQDRIFDPFFTTKEVGKGTGLGLSIVYSAAYEHEGKVEFETTVGKGTRFEIVIPQYYQKSETNLEKGADEQELYLEKDTSLNNKTILIADDDSIVTLVTVRMLHNLGYQIITASNGREAVEIYRRERHNIQGLVFDISMPHMTGTEAYESICKLGNPPPILFCTGDATPELRHVNLAAKGYRFIRKPFNQNTLEKMMDELFSDALETI